MLTSELIEKLQKAQEKYGDQEIAIESKNTYKIIINGSYYLMFFIK